MCVCVCIGDEICLIRYFKEHGWPSSTIFKTPPEDDAVKAKLIDTLQVLNLGNLNFALSKVTYV